MKTQDFLHDSGLKFQLASNQIRVKAWCGQKDWIRTFLERYSRCIKSRSRTLMEEDWGQVFNPNSFLNTYRRNADQKKLERERGVWSRTKLGKNKKMWWIKFLLRGQFKTLGPFQSFPEVISKQKQSNSSISRPYIAL